MIYRSTKEKCEETEPRRDATFLVSSWTFLPGPLASVNCVGTNLLQHGRLEEAARPREAMSGHGPRRQRQLHPLSPPPQVWIVAAALQLGILAGDLFSLYHPPVYPCFGLSQLVCNFLDVTLLVDAES